MSFENKIAHLGFIQGVINRMGGNSFMVKGWTVALVAAIFSLAANDSNGKFVLVAIVPVFFFWFLDAYYLCSERFFINLYKDVSKGNISSDEFTMNANPSTGFFCAYIIALFSKSVVPFYLLIFSLFALVAANLVFGVTFGFFPNLHSVKNSC